MFEFFNSPAATGALIGATASLFIHLAGWLYSLYLRKQQKVREHEEFTAAALKVQLEGWVNYARILNDQIEGLRKVVREKDVEMDALWVRIRALERGKQDK